MADRTGQQIDKYHLIKLLGGGAFGDVYLGKDIYDPTLVAIKVLKLEPTSQTLKEFLNEARTFRLRHPNIVPLLDFGIDGETAFLVMEYAPNGTLRQRHPPGSILAPETVITYVEPVAAALQYAHDKRLIHRDVKPSNILLGKNNEILLSDFGIAVIAHNENSLNTQETQGGTVPYMAPEQIQKKPRPASDQYALGIVVYEWLCGMRPFQGPNWDVSNQHIYTPPPLLREKNPAIPPPIEQVVLKALAKEPQERYSNIQTFAQALKDAIEQIEDTKRRNAPQVQVSPPLIEIKKISSLPPSIPDAQVIEKKSTAPLLPPNPSQIPLTPREPASVPATPIVAPKAGATTHLPHPRRSAVNTGAKASQGRASAGIVAPRPGGPGGIPPRSIPPGGGGRGNGYGPRSRSGWIILGLLVLAIALLSYGGLMAFAQPQSLPGQIAHSLISRQQSPASITITPNSQTVQDTYTLIGASTTNPTSRQVAVHTITGAAQSPAIPVKATGHSQHDAVAASGQITFFNSLAFSRQVNAGQTLNVGGGIQIVTDKTAFITAANPPTEGSATVPAHAIPAGRGGNIGAYTFSAASCCAPNINVTNTAAFTGGQDAVNYAHLQQSDVNNAVSQSIKDVIKQDALNDLKRQLGAGVQLLGSISCTPTLRADEPIGDQGTNVNSANVSYLMKCISTAYDNQGAQTIVKGLLTQKASSTLTPGYVLINNIQVSLTNQAATTNTLSLFFSGKGVWAYQFTDAQKLQLAKAIAGKTVAEAQSILKNTPGIGNATINVNGDSTLPTDYNQISIVIQPITGLGSGGTPPPTSGSPTITNPTVQSATPGSNGKGGSAPPNAGS